MNRRGLLRSAVAVVGFAALAPFIPATSTAKRAGLTMAEVRDAARTLRVSGVKPPYVCIVHPDTVADLFSDTEIVNTFRHATFNEPPGVVGDLLGIRFIESADAPHELRLVAA